MDRFLLPDMLFAQTYQMIANYTQTEFNQLKFDILMKRNESLSMSPSQWVEMERQAKQAFDFFC